MTPSRELDALVAEKAMGLKDILNSDGYWCHFTDDKPREIPLYSTDIAAAWEVLAHFTKLGWDAEVQSSGEHYDDGHWVVILDPRYVSDEKCGLIVQSAYSAPHAICLAALKACGVEV